MPRLSPFSFQSASTVAQKAQRGLTKPGVSTLPRKATFEYIKREFRLLVDYARPTLRGLDSGVGDLEVEGILMGLNKVANPIRNEVRVIRVAIRGRALAST
jgi:hypothetical protein